MGRIKGFFRRINRAVTEVGIEHFSDDKDWDERVKLPAWQTARLRERYERKKAEQAADHQNQPAATARVKSEKDGNA
ncbi:hypothetical protein N9N07_00845 [Pseudomonadales bacterium]|nr:hypothetical protein [Pseudomonadales bacterium]